MKQAQAQAQAQAQVALLPLLSECVVFFLFGIPRRQALFLQLVFPEVRTARRLLEAGAAAAAGRAAFFCELLIVIFELLAVVCFVRHDAFLCQAPNKGGVGIF